MAKLYYRYGAMNSGKSTALLQVAHNYEERGMHVLLIKSAVDTKGDDTVISRMGLTRKVDILLGPKDSLAHHQKLLKNIDCILVDEAQFLTLEQVDELFALVIDKNIPVVCYGLRTDFQRQSFTGSLRLFELAHSIEELKTICRCGKKAIFNGRKVDGQFVFSGQQVAIDGEHTVSYEALCGNCYMQELS